MTDAPEECPDVADADAAATRAIRRHLADIEPAACPVCRGLTTRVGDTSCCTFCGWLG